MVYKHVFNICKCIQRISIESILKLWRSSPTSRLEACAITCLPKLVVLCFIGGPFGGKSHPLPTNTEPFVDHWALRGPMLLDFLTKTLMDLLIVFWYLFGWMLASCLMSCCLFRLRTQPAKPWKAFTKMSDAFPHQKRMIFDIAHYVFRYLWGLWILISVGIDVGSKTIPTTTP